MSESSKKAQPPLKTTTASDEASRCSAENTKNLEETWNTNNQAAQASYEARSPLHESTSDSASSLTILSSQKLTPDNAVPEPRQSPSEQESTAQDDPDSWSTEPMQRDGTPLRKSGTQTAAQLTAWAYETRDFKLVFTENVEKRNWEDTNK